MTAWLKVRALVKSSRAIAQILGKTRGAIPPQKTGARNKTTTAYHDMVKHKNMRKQEWDGCPLSAETIMAPTDRKQDWRGPDFYSRVWSFQLHLSSPASHTIFLLTKQIIDGRHKHFGLAEQDHRM
jgi:hypothetical protein